MKAGGCKGWKIEENRGKLEVVKIRGCGGCRGCKGWKIEEG